MTNIKKKNNLISSNHSISEAVKILDVRNIKSLIVIDKKRKVLGSFTAGDFRRAAFRGLDLRQSVLSVINKKFTYLFEGYTAKDATIVFNKNSYIFEIPIVNKNFKLIDIISRDDFKNIIKSKFKKTNLKNIPVVIMAGGKGLRMQPFTKILPKPLIPIGNKPIIELIMDEFNKFGFKNFFITINYKGKMIKGYFHNNNLPYKINYVEEKKMLGTAGSLRKIKKNSSKYIFVSNSDVLIHADYREIYNFHINGKYDLTLISSSRNYEIPYGICHVDEMGRLKSLEEKPKFDYLVNSGLYLLNYSIIKLIPKNKIFDMTDFIKLLQKSNYKIGVYPVSEKAWIDVGEWNEYNRAIKVLVN